MNPHIVFNVNIPGDGATGMQSGGGEELPTPFTAGGGAGGDAMQAIASQEKLPTPFDVTGADAASASSAPAPDGQAGLALGSMSAASAGRLPTPMDGPGGQGGSGQSDASCGSCSGGAQGPAALPRPAG